MAREVDELYELPPEQFTAARDALARAARAGGDRDRAGEVAALRRPTVAAWLLNQLARQRADEVGQFVALGAELREATAALDAHSAGDLLRELSTERRRLVRALVDQARGLAGQQGRRVTEDVLRSVEETLHAALADAEVASRLRAGRLTTAISRTGFAPATERAAVEPPAPAPRRRTRGRSGDEALERRLAEAWSAARSAAEQRDQAVAEEEDARRTAAEAAREHDLLTSAVADARSAVVTARAALEAAEAEAAEAEERAARAGETRASAEAAVRAAAERQLEAEEAADRARRRVGELTERLDRQRT